MVATTPGHGHREGEPKSCDLNELQRWRSKFGKAEAAEILCAEF